ncbi:nuclear transport factor 2 family protein [Desertimonas flava]|uniref:nuclear transport factor 2 family protein n=1 Tax=Desertimonas flava TaxID=2064846 RepID=UPI0013C411FF|nr:hypothetical protein [Desertimonas flava]
MTSITPAVAYRGMGDATRTSGCLTLNGEGVRRHHLRLQHWLAGGDQAALEEFVGAHGEDFTLVRSDGAVLTRDQMVAALREVGGSQPDLEIDISEISSPTAGAVRFLERHTRGSKSELRRVTALVDGNTWLSVHETTVRSRRGTA